MPRDPALLSLAPPIAFALIGQQHCPIEGNIHFSVCQTSTRNLGRAPLFAGCFKAPASLGIKRMASPRIAQRCCARGVVSYVRRNRMRECDQAGRGELESKGSMMFQNRILAVSLLALAAATGVPASVSAQPYPAYRVYPEQPRYQHRIPPQEVVAIVRSMGLAPTSAPRPRGPFWVVDAVGRDGSPIRVSLDGHNGRVNEIVRVPGPRLVRVYPGGPGPAPGDFYDGPPPAAYGGPRGPGMNEPRYYGDDDGDDYPMKDGPAYRGQGEQNYYGGPRGSVQPMPSGPRVITRDGDVTNSVPRQASRGTGNDPLLGVPREFRGEQKPKTEQKKTAAKPAEKNPATAPTPKPRPADAPSVAKTDTTTTPATAPQAKPEPQKPTAATAKPSAAKPSTPPVQGFE